MCIETIKMIITLTDQKEVSNQLKNLTKFKLILYIFLEFPRNDSSTRNDQENWRHGSNRNQNHQSENNSNRCISHNLSHS